MQDFLKVNIYAKSAWKDNAAHAKTCNTPFLVHIWLAYPIINSKIKFSNILVSHFLVLMAKYFHAKKSKNHYIVPNRQMSRYINL